MPRSSSTTGVISCNIAFMLLCLLLIAISSLVASRYSTVISETLAFAPIDLDDGEEDKVCIAQEEYKKLKEKKQSEDVPTDKVCMPQDEYQKLVELAQKPTEVKYYIPTTTTIVQQQETETPTHNYSVQERDYRVLYDPLFPPLNRTDSSTYQALRANMQQRNWYESTSIRATNDTYRLVAYVTTTQQDGSVDAGGNNWKLMARMKDRNMADFYMIPANRNYDMKIHVSDDMVVGTRLRDLYSIPDQLTFDSPLLHKTPYVVTEVSKSDLVFTNDGMYM